MKLSRDEATFRELAIEALYFQIWKTDKHGSSSKVHLDEISTLVMDYFDVSSDATINSRSDQDVKNANNVEITTLGQIKWTLQTLDTTVQDSTLDDGELEQHAVVFKWTLTDGLSSSMRLNLYIERESKV